MSFYFPLGCAVVGLLLTIWLIRDVRKTNARINDELAEQWRRQSVDAAFRTTGQKILHPGFNRRFK